MRLENNFSVFIFVKPLYSNIEFIDAKADDLLPFSCYNCGNTFHYQKKRIKHFIKNNINNKANFCSKTCNHHYYGFSIEVSCANCDKPLKRNRNQYLKSKSGNHFCSRSCAATYNNTHKKYGTRKSKLEVWLETKLTETYPDLEIHFNRKDAINSELDIYIPSLKLAFELNGIYHYEPIHGQDKLSQVQNNDNRKFQACLEQGIELCIIDTSQQKYFKEKTSIKYLDIILNILISKNMLNI